MEIVDGFDIAAYSMMNAQAKIADAVGVQMLKKTMDLQEIQGNELVRMMEQSVNPGLGRSIDILV